MFRRYLNILALCVLAAAAVSCHYAGGGADTLQMSRAQLDTASAGTLEDWVAVHPDDLGALNRLWGIYTNESEYEKLLEHAIPIYNMAKERGELQKQADAGIYIGQAYVMMAKPDSMYKYFDEVTAVARDNGMDGCMMFISNSIGIHNLMYAMNYNEALHYFYEALDYSNGEDDRNYWIVLSNIVNVFYLREDPSGLEMALDIYDWGVRNGADFVTYRGALGAAYMYFIEGDYRKALEYAEATTRQEAYRNGFNNSDALHGDILFRLGRNREAEIYYLRALSESRDVSTRIESYLGYGNFLRQTGRLREAVDMYLQGLVLVEEHKMYFYGHKLYSALSEAYSALGRDDMAVEYMKTYQEVVDSVFNVEKERSFSNLRLQYEEQMKQNQLKEKDIEILRQRQGAVIAVSAVVVLLVALAVFYLYYRKKTSMYRGQVMRYEAQMRREKLLEESAAVQQSAKEAPVQQEEPAGEIQEDRLRQLFSQIEALMKEEELYKRSDISVDMFTSRLQTNRSYISKAINTYAATTFSGYVNSYRIRKAVEMLSDPHKDVPIKVIATELGYNSLQSFYTNFQKETGVPPSRYRQEVLKMSREEVQ